MKIELYALSIQCDMCVNVCVFVFRILYLLSFFFLKVKIPKMNHSSILFSRIDLCDHCFSQRSMRKESKKEKWRGREGEYGRNRVCRFLCVHVLRLNNTTIRDNNFMCAIASVLSVLPSSCFRMFSHSFIPLLIASHIALYYLYMCVCSYERNSLRARAHPPNQSTQQQQ